MKYRATDDIELELVESFDEATETPDTITDRFKKGDIVDMDIVSSEDSLMEVQFGDGSVAYAVPEKWFEKC